MFDVLKAWSFKYFHDPEAAILLIVLALGIALIWIFGELMFPLLSGLIVAYLLDSLISAFQKRLHCPRIVALTVVYVVFIGLFAYVLIGLLPMLYRQLLQLATQLPQFLTQFHAFLADLPERYPGLISQSTVQGWVSSTNFNLDALSSIGGSVLSSSVNSLGELMTLVVYVFLIPLITFFLLKDKTRLLKGFNYYMPEERGLILEVFREMRGLIGRYVRGKVFEVVLVTVVSWVGFGLLHLNFSFLLAVLVGLSAIIPYVGAIVVTIPVLAVALLQWGPTPHFVYAAIVYGAIQILDGNILVPILYAGAVNLNPVVIIAAVLFFGGIWGFWGLFFAIPLATFVKAVVNAWIRHANLTYEDKLARRAQQELPLSRR